MNNTNTTTNINQKNVLFFCRFPPPFCGETIGSKLVYDLLKQDLEITTLELLDNNREIDDGGKFRLKRAFKTLYKLYLVLKLVKSTRPDSFYMVPAASRLGHLRDIMIVLLVRPHVGRIVCHIRNGNFHNILSLTGMKNLSKRFIDKTDYFIFLGKNLSAMASGIIPDEKRVIIPNTIDDDVRFNDTEIEQKLINRNQQNKRIFNILFLSNMHLSKGYMDLVDALSEINSNISWMAHFVGSWPSEKEKVEFYNKIETLGISKHVKVHGAVKNRKDVRTMLVESDVFVLPTYYPIEAQPRSIIEALNAGTPVIATRHASITEYVYDGQNGYLVDKKSPKQITEALHKLVDMDNWQSKAQIARKSYLDNFDTNAIRKSLFEVIGG
jgi:glycosyltransferase involved in cell wall biosynthesis